MEKQSFMRMAETTAVFLFFVQAVRVLFSVLFGVIYDAIFTGPLTLYAIIANLLVFLAFSMPLLAGRSPSRRLLLITAWLVFLARVPLTWNDPQIRLYSSLCIVAAGGLYAADLLREAPDVFPWAWMIALAIDQLLRAAGNTYDITLRTWWLPMQYLLSGMLFLASLFVHRFPGKGAPQTGIGFLGGLAIGAFLFLETSLLSLPHALARWSCGSYAVLTPLLLLITLLPLLYGVQGSSRPWRGPNRAWGMVFLLLACGSMAVGYWTKGLLAAVSLLLLQWLALLALPSVLRERKDSKEQIGLYLALGFLFFLLINFAYAFAFTYAYTLGFFRGAGLPIFLVAILVYILPAVLRGLRFPEPFSYRTQWLVAGAIVLLVLLSAVFAFPSSPRIRTAEQNVRVGTYNIHYGYNTTWQFSLEEMAKTIEESGADVVVLQEVDAGRITSYCVDDALWLARRLRMEAFYQPTIERLTGIAMLYRLPLAKAEGQLLTSQLEQTAIIHTRLQVGGKKLDAYGTWFGLEPEERAVQLSEALAFMGQGAAVFGGDLNSTPDSPIYQRLTEAGFVDPFVAIGLAPLPTSPSEQPEERIDYVWVRGLKPVDARVLDSTASDHRMVVVEVRLE
ncbi:MAG: endonuclease/exonuclease/phosphatase family protein [Anaerolineae bacterium]